MRKWNLNAMLIISIIAFAFASTFAFLLKHSWEPERDDRHFDTIGRNLAEGRGFSLAVAEPYLPTMLREPAYPFFLALVYKIFGHNLVPVLLFQVLLFAATCFFVYRLAFNIFGEKVAIFSAALCAISPTLANYPTYLLSETLFTFLLCLAVFTLTKAYLLWNGFWFMMSGLVLASAVLCKSILSLFFFIAIVSLAIFGWRRPATFKNIAIFVCAFSLLVGLWSVRNYSIFGTYQISLRGGAALWEKAQKLDKSLDEMGQEAIFNFSEYLGSKLFPDAAIDGRDVILEGSRMAYYKDLELAKLGLTPLEIDRAMRKEAIHKIRRQPMRFLLQIPIEMIKLTAFMHLPTLNDPLVIDWFNALKYGGFILSALRGAIRLCAYPMLVLACLGAFLTRRLWRRWYFLLAAIIYINLAYSLLFAMGRYTVPLLPFYSVFAAAGLVALFERGEGRV